MFLAFGIALFLLFFNNDVNKIIFAFALFAVGAALFYYDRFSFRSFIYAASSLALFGFLWTFLYQSFFVYKITGKVFAEVKGEVVDVKNFHNPINQRRGVNLIIKNPTLYKSEYVAKKKIKKNRIKKTAKKVIEKPPSKRFLKKIAKCDQDQSCIDLVTQEFEQKKIEKEQKRQEKKRLKDEEKKRKKLIKEAKKQEKQIAKYYLNLKNYQEVDRKFLDQKSNYQEVNWLDVKMPDGKIRQVFPDHLGKISLISNRASDVKIGDVVFFSASLNPAQKKDFLSEYDYAFDADLKGVGAFGYVRGDIKILKESSSYFVAEFISNLRKKIADKMMLQIKGDEGAIAAALMVGTQSLISKEAMVKIRNSGLAHLLSISGLHFASASAIFFWSIRFLLSRSQYLALNFDIKKIAAVFAILSSYFYLLLADSPVPAVRSFIMIALVFLAIIFDRKSDAKRALAFAAFILLIVNPYNVFSVSFQLSFAAILALLCFHEYLSNLKSKFEISSPFAKFGWYFLEIISASIVAQIATLPFLLYHFSNFSSYGFISNLAAIPLSTFVTMPLGFLSLLLMPFGLEKFSLYLMGLSITWIIDIANFVTNLNYSYFLTNQMPKAVFVAAVVSGFIICVMQGKIKWLAILIFTASCSLVFLPNKPDLLFDGSQRFFAIYNQDDGLVFSENLKPSKKREMWLKFVNQSNFKSFASQGKAWQEKNNINCDDQKCELRLKNKQILVLFKRNKLSEVCNKSADIIVNLSARYQLPACFNEKAIKIDNLDFQQKGGQFLYITDDGLVKMKTAR